MRKQMTLTILFLITVLVSVSACSAADRTVGSGGDYSNIEDAYSAADEGDTIIIADGIYTGTKNNGIIIDKNINITGQSQTGTILNAENEDYFFHINSGRTVTINNLTFEDGGDTYNGGAISNAGTLTISDCTFESNEAENDGGAIYNDFGGTLTITDCIFTGNTAYMGGAINNNHGTMTVISSIFTANTAGPLIGGGGGAIFNWGTGTITNNIFTGNSAMFGGALYNRPQSPAEGTLTVTGSNIASNTAFQGGALYNWGPLTAHFNRIVGNTATDPNDGSNAIHNAWSGIIYGENNWWGSNADPKRIPNLIVATDGSGVNVDVDPWLILNINADPSTIYTGQTSKITANVYTDSNGADHSADAAQFFSGPEVTFTTDLGNVGSKTVTVDWILGQAFATLSGDEGPGIATVTAADVETLSTTVNILQAPLNPDDDEVTPSDPVTPTENEVNAATDTTNTTSTVRMQETGIPIAVLILAILAVFGGLLVPKRK